MGLRHTNRRPTLKLRSNYSLLLTATILLSAMPVFADASFDAFWTKFKTAVAKKDKAAVASMTKLPYELESKQLNSSQFIAKYDVVFPRATMKCFAKEKPVKDKDSYFVFCGESIYCFNKVQGKWMFTEIGAND
jgi:hypothetical protein